MTEDEFCDVFAWDGVHHALETYVIDLVVAVDALARSPGRDDLARIVGDIAEHVTRFVGFKRWRLSALATSAPVDFAAVQVAVVDLARLRPDYHRNSPWGDRAIDLRLAELVAVIWRGTIAVAQAAGLEVGAILDERARTRRPGTPRPTTWRPIPLREAIDGSPFTLAFAALGGRPAGALSLEATSAKGDTLVMLSRTGEPDELVELDNRETAIAAFEANARAFEARGAHAVISSDGRLPGSLEPFSHDAATEIEFAGDKVTRAWVSDDDPVSFDDCLVPSVAAETQSIGAFSPRELVPVGVIGIHLLRRLFAHPGVHHPAFRLRLSFAAYAATAVLDWLVATPYAHYVRALSVGYSERGLAPRPLGGELPALESLTLGYRDWPRWSAVPFPALMRLELYRADWNLPPSELLVELRHKVPRLHVLHIGATYERATSTWW